ncbi:MAG: hypothetical protein MI974_32945 [Chitinophagales bacterium]|nr:hypothetical protein [Chitinophagales bacterium]
MLVKPNIFDISGKELDQDAFMIWLLKWAKQGMDKLNPLLWNSGQSFLQALMSEKSTEINWSVTKLKILPQLQKADLALIIELKYFL